MKQKMKKNKGFTLIELLIVVAIIAILIVVGILAIVNVRKNTQLTTFDATAKEIYLAAQNQMLQMKEYGQWDAMIEANKDSNSYFGTSMIAYDAPPSDFSEWSSPLGSSANLAWESIREDMYIIGFQGSGDLPGILNRILPLGSVEDVVRTTGTYIIEYNLKNAEIYAVFYTESKDQLSWTSDHFITSFYGPSAEGRPTREDASKSKSLRRDYKDGAKFIIGYFGGGMLGDSVIKDELTIPDVMVQNGEDLVVFIKDSNSNGDMNHRAGSAVTIRVTGKTSNKDVVYRIIQPETPDGTYSLAEIKDGIDKLNPKYLVKKATEGEHDISYEVILDSLTREIANPDTSVGQNAHFAANFADLIPGEDITVTVSVGASGKMADDGMVHIAVPVARKVETNSLFAAAEIDKDSKTVTDIKVEQLRHLENISPGISGVKLWAGDSGVTVNLEHSVSFNDKGGGLLPVLPKDYSDKTITYLEDTPAVVYPENSFVPIDLPSNSKVTVNGNNNYIYNIRIQSPSGDVGGIGLFGNVSGSLTIRNLGIVSNDYVTAESTESSAILTVYRDSEGRAPALGAFAGNVAGTLQIDRCWSTVLMWQNGKIGQTDVGGLVGRCSGALTISNSYVSGQTGTDPNKPGKFDIYPKDANIFVNVTSSTEVNEGGLVGYAGGDTVIKNCYVTNSVGIGMNDVYRTGNYNVGGFVGKVQTGLNVTNSYHAGYLNLPASVELGKEAKLHYAGFVGSRGEGVPATAIQVDSSSYWIEEFHVQTDVLSDSDLQSCARSISTVGLSGTTRAYPYDFAHKGKDYPYADVTGLGHHWGDWTTEFPELKIYLIPELGLNKIVTLDTVQGQSGGESFRTWAPYQDKNLVYGQGFYREESQGSGLTLNLNKLVKELEYKTGFRGMAFTDNNAVPIANPGSVEADKHTIVIYVSAAALDPIDLEFIASSGMENPIDPEFIPSSGMEEREKRYEQLYGVGEDIRVEAENRTPYDPGIQIAYFISVKREPGDPDYRNLMPVNGNAYNLISVLNADRLSAQDGSAFFDIPKDQHYSTLYYGIRAFAFYIEPMGITPEEMIPLEEYKSYLRVADDGSVSLQVPEGKRLPRILFSEIPVTPIDRKDELTFDVNLFRSELVFRYDGSQIEGRYNLNGQKQNVSFYVGYASNKLMTVPGGANIAYVQDSYGKYTVIVTPEPGMTADGTIVENPEVPPPLPQFEIPNAFIFFGWDYVFPEDSTNRIRYYLYEEDGEWTLSEVYYVKNGNSWTQREKDETNDPSFVYTVPDSGKTVWLITETQLELTPYLDYIEGEREIDIGGGYFD